MLKSLIIAGVILASSIVSNPVSACESNPNVYEIFDIVSIENGEIRGEIVQGLEGQGEGIYLLQKEFMDKGIEVGDRIIVTYDKDDYANEIWDNIVEIEVLEKL